jgi:acyl-coenzyme A thioesterase PaaI-like protein
MNYKYITGKVLDIPNPDRWSSLDQLLEWWPETFVSGSQNDYGMKLSPILNNSIIVSKYNFESRFQGGPGLVHGGILSAALDDLMGYACVIHDRSCVTAKLEINYIKPVPVEKEFLLEAWVTNIEDKKLYLESSISSDNEVHIEGSGLFIDLGNYPGQLFEQNKNYP